MRNRLAFVLAPLLAVLAVAAWNEPASAAVTAQPPRAIAPAGEPVGVGPAGVPFSLQALDYGYGPVRVEAWNEAGATVTLATHFELKPWALTASLPAPDLDPASPGTLYAGPRGTLFWRAVGSCPGPEGGVLECASAVREFEYVLPKAESLACVAAMHKVRFLVARIAKERKVWASTRGPRRRAAREKWLDSRSKLRRAQRYVAATVRAEAAGPVGV